MYLDVGRDAGGEGITHTSQLQAVDEILLELLQRLVAAAGVVEDVCLDLSFPRHNAYLKT